MKNTVLSRREFETEIVCMAPPMFYFSDPQKKCMAVGIGSLLRGDDAVGIHLMRRIQEYFGPELHCMEVHAPDILMAEIFSKMDYVLITDAMQMAEEIPYRLLSIEPVDEIEPSPGFVTHAVDWQTILGMAGAFYGHIPKMELLAVGAADFGFSETLSEACAANADKAFAFLTGCQADF